MNDILICKCLEVYKSDIINAIVQNNLQSVTEIIDETQAGSGCGSCIDELEKLLELYGTK